MGLQSRYERHYSLKGFGPAAQEKLAGAKVLVVGAGGLGCPVLQYLAASGVGTLGIADPDSVSLSNLQRQVIYTTEDLGKPKVEAALKRVAKQNPEISLIGHQVAMAVSNALEIIRSYDIVVDCTDNFSTRYLLNDVCVLLRKPLVFGAVFQYEGQVAVFNVPSSNGREVNYRHLFPVPPDALEVPNCNEAGVLGVLPGIIGVMQATEVIKLIAGLGDLLAGKLLTLNLLNYRTFIVEIPAGDTPILTLPRTREEIENTDYDFLCGVSRSGVGILGVEEFLERKERPDTVVIDVREISEQPRPWFPCLEIPLRELEENCPVIEEKAVILVCQSGKRSLNGARKLLEIYGNSRNIFHLEGGVTALIESGYEQN